MIRRDEFRKIKIEVDNALNELFDFALKNEKNKNDFLLFLADAEKLPELEKSGLNPYVINYALHRMADEERLIFMTQYLQSSYNFNAENTVDSKSSVTFELMIFTHVWESKPFFRRLYQLANFCDSKEFEWQPHIISDKRKLVQNLMKRFDKYNLKIKSIIEKGYHYQLRNAFAHSDYMFGLNHPEIILRNFSNKPNEIKSIHFDEWTKRFCYTFLLSYEIEMKFNNIRKNLDHGLPGYQVQLKDKLGKKGIGNLEYDAKKDDFKFVR